MAGGGARRMILGLGTDLIDVRRIERTLARFGERFVARVCTETERARAARRPSRAAEVAKFYAAKEACSKALGTGFRKGVFWRDIGVVSRPTGKPELVLTGGAARRLRSLVPDGFEARLDLSLTDEYPMAQAVVIVSAVPRGTRLPDPDAADGA